MSNIDYSNCEECKYWYIDSCWNDGNHKCPKEKKPYRTKCSLCGNTVEIVKGDHYICERCQKAVQDFIYYLNKKLKNLEKHNEQSR